MGRINAGRLKYDGALINPKLLNEDDAKEYGEAVKGFIDSVNIIMKINKKHSELSKKAYKEVFTDDIE